MRRNAAVLFALFLALAVTGLAQQKSPEAGARQSVIIARLSGAQVDRTSVFAGMSGSPVYIDGKLVGAVAYAFPFAKEPIAGITPYKQMVDMFERGGQTSVGRDQMGFLREPHAVSYSQLAGADWKPRLPAGQARG